MRREVTALVAEGADPDLGGEINTGEGVESSGAGLATQRRVRERGDIRMRTDRGNGSGEWDHALGGFDFGTRPNVPRHTDSVDSFRICAGHFRHD